MIVTDYWFVIEPYVYISVNDNYVLLYNTIDGVTIESDRAEVINLVRGTLQKENCGVVLLTYEQYKQNKINGFIEELREKFMGDIIDVTLSNGKPVQLLPFYNLSDKHELYIRHNFSSFKNVLENLIEISIHVDYTTNVNKLISFLQSVPGNLTFNICGNLGDVVDYKELMSFFDKQPSSKKIFCSYTDIISLQPIFNNNFSYIISVNFPLYIQQWNNSRQIFLNTSLPYSYVFEVTNLEDCQQVEDLVEQFNIEKYQLKPVFTGNNLDFFKENVFLTKEDILSISTSIKDIFIRQSMNTYDFGRINVMSNGDIYANIYHPVLGNIFNHSIYEIIQNEVEEGKSWFRVRNQAPCSSCIYQWLCPSPSNYEITIGRPNLCHVIQ